MEAVVVSATHGGLKILLGKLGDLISTRMKLLSEVQDEIQELKDELESLTACLRDLNGGDDENRSEQVRHAIKIKLHELRTFNFLFVTSYIFG